MWGAARSGRPSPLRPSPRRVPRRTHRRCRASWLVSQLGSPQPLLLPSAGPAPPPPPPPRLAPPTWPWDPTLGHHLAAAPVSPANWSRSSQPCRPIRGCEGSWLRPRCDPGWLLPVALPPRSCPDSLRSGSRRSSAIRGRPSYSTRSARSPNDHAAPPLHTQMAKDLVAPLPGGD